ncbi:hypothetical protein BHM03_00006423 [Ensete ventricosum]|nr:hypothetical protein BHM03_00006423 [Ensete ventricosum]
MHDAASAFKITKQGIRGASLSSTRTWRGGGTRDGAELQMGPHQALSSQTWWIEHITVTHAQRSTVLLERQGGMGRLGATPWDAKMLYYLQAYDDHLNLLDRLILAQPQLGLSSHSRMIDDISKNNSSS